MGNLLDALTTQADSPQRGDKCSIGRLLQDLDTDDMTTLAAALADNRWSHAQLSRALADIGRKHSAGTIARHRRNECRCP